MNDGFSGAAMLFIHPHVPVDDMLEKNIESTFKQLQTVAKDLSENYFLKSFIKCVVWRKNS